MVLHSLAGDPATGDAPGGDELPGRPFSRRPFYVTGDPRRPFRVCRFPIPSDDAGYLADGLYVCRACGRTLDAARGTRTGFRHRAIRRRRPIIGTGSAR